jgi:hypothetical protein
VRAAGCNTLVSSFDSRSGAPWRLPKTRSSSAALARRSRCSVSARTRCGPKESSEAPVVFSGAETDPRRPTRTRAAFPAPSRLIASQRQQLAHAQARRSDESNHRAMRCANVGQQRSKRPADDQCRRFLLGLHPDSRSPEERGPSCGALDHRPVGEAAFPEGDTRVRRTLPQQTQSSRPRQRAHRRPPVSRGRRQDSPSSATRRLAQLLLPRFVTGRVLGSAEFWDITGADPSVRVARSQTARIRIFMLKASVQGRAILGEGRTVFRPITWRVRKILQDDRSRGCADPTPFGNLRHGCPQAPGDVRRLHVWRTRNDAGRRLAEGRARHIRIGRNCCGLSCCSLHSAIGLFAREYRRAPSG